MRSCDLFLIPAMIPMAFVSSHLCNWYYIVMNKLVCAKLNCLTSSFGVQIFMLDSHETIFSLANVHVKLEMAVILWKYPALFKPAFFLSFFFFAGAAVGIVVAMVAAGITFLWGEQAG